ncbi:MAG TPA: TIGR02466 family protein [Xanthobacteraceae bacterium]
MKRQTMPLIDQLEPRTSLFNSPIAARTAALSAKQVFMLFPTPMFTGMLSDISMCDRIEKKLRELQRAGKGFPSPGLILAYMTPDDLQTLPEMQELVEVILAESATVLDVYAIKRDSHYIANMWANIANPNRRHNFHIHPNCLLSGIVYIKTPRNCGRTIFASPRMNSKLIEPTYFQKNELNADIFSMPPEKGRMMIWPSHVAHSVEQGSANEAEDRIVVAFNIMIRGLIEQPTARLHLG